MTTGYCPTTAIGLDLDQRRGARQRRHAHKPCWPEDLVREYLADGRGIRAVAGRRIGDGPGFILTNARYAQPMSFDTNVFWT